MTRACLMMLALLACAAASALVCSGSIVASISSDMSPPHSQFGAQQSAASKSQMGADGLNQQASFDIMRNNPLSSLMGPPLQIANSFALPDFFGGNSLVASNIAAHNPSKTTEQQTVQEPMQQQQLEQAAYAQQHPATIGVDSNILERLGQAKLAKGGLLLGAYEGKKALAKLKAGPIGKKVASIVEFPIKVVAIKDILEGKKLVAAGQMFNNKNPSQQQQNIGQEQLETKSGEVTQTNGNSMNKFNLFGGSTPAFGNLGEMANQAATSLRLMPLVMEQFAAPMLGNYAQQTNMDPSGGVKGTKAQPSMFGGLGPMMNFGGLGKPNYAAIVGSNPLINLLSSPDVKPLLFPSTSISYSHQPSSFGFLQAKRPNQGGDLLGGFLGTGSMDSSRPELSKTQQPIVQQQQIAEQQPIKGQQIVQEPQSVKTQQQIVQEPQHIKTQQQTKQPPQSVKTHEQQHQEMVKSQQQQLQPQLQPQLPQQPTKQEQGPASMPQPTLAPPSHQEQQQQKQQQASGPAPSQ